MTKKTVLFVDAADFCGSNMFKCDNLNCVLKNYICDGYNDCGDMSDEQNCHSTSPPSKYNHLVIGLLYCINPSAKYLLFLMMNSYCLSSVMWKIGY